MKSNAELKAEAKEMLQGRWRESILLALIPTLISLILSFVLIIAIAIPSYLLFRDNISQMVDSGNVSVNVDLGGGNSSGSIIGGLIAALFTAGISWTFLDVLRGRRMAIEPFRDVFRGFRSPYALGIIVIFIISYVFQTLWALLFIIPGIVKSYAYSQAHNIFYDAYESTGQVPKYVDTITASRRLMDGYKGQLFILDLSFIGWHILAVMTLGIGYLWLNPYIYATKAAFYNNLPK